MSTEMLILFTMVTKPTNCLQTASLSQLVHLPKVMSSFQSVNDMKVLTLSRKSLASHLRHQLRHQLRQVQSEADKLSLQITSVLVGSGAL